MHNSFCFLLNIEAWHLLHHSCGATFLTDIEMHKEQVGDDDQQGWHADDKLHQHSGCITEMSRNLVEGLRKHLSGIGGGVTNDEIGQIPDKR